jgi:hypothetical protein
LSKTNTIQVAQKPTGKMVRFAEGVKGIIYLILAVSLIFAIVLGQTGVIITLEDIIDNLILAQAGKVILAIIAVALLIYGLKNLRILK